MSRAFGVIAVLLLLFSWKQTNGAVLYTVTDLGTARNVSAINAQGEVLANDTSGAPFVSLNGQREYLPQPSGGTFTAEALNDLGQVAGYVNNSGAYNYNLAVYSQGALNIFSNLGGLDPTAINNAGQISGVPSANYLS